MPGKGFDGAEVGGRGKVNVPTDAGVVSGICWWKPAGQDPLCCASARVSFQPSLPEVRRLCFCLLVAPPFFFDGTTGAGKSVAKCAVTSSVSVSSAKFMKPSPRRGAAPFVVVAAAFSSSSPDMRIHPSLPFWNMRRTLTATASRDVNWRGILFGADALWHSSNLVSAFAVP